MIEFDGKISVLQSGTRSLDEIWAEGRITFQDNQYFVFLKQESYFVDPNELRSRFSAFVELNENNENFDFELDLVENSTLDMFRVIENEQFKLFKTYCERQKLEKELVVKDNIKQRSAKI